MHTTSNNPTVGSRNYSGASPPAQSQPQQYATTPALRVVDDAFLLDDIATDLPEIDWMSVRQFLAEQEQEVRDDATGRARFGRWVNEAADGYGMVYTSAHDAFLGTVRLFPRVLLVKAYKERRAALKWPPMTRIAPADGTAPAVGIPEGAPVTQEVANALIAQLRMLAEASQSNEVRASAQTLLNAVRREGLTE